MQTAPEEPLGEFGDRYRMHLYLGTLAEQFAQGLPPGWRFTVTFEGGDYGRYKLTDERGRNVLIPRGEGYSPEPVFHCAWKAYQVRESAIACGGGGEVDS